MTDTENGLDRFCGSIFWNASQTWYTESPALTPCFEKTVLTWIPFVSLFVFSPFDVFNILTQKTKTASPRSYRFVAKLVFCGIIALMSVAGLCHCLIEAYVYNNSVYPADITSLAQRLLSSVACVILMHYEHANGITTSGSMFLFWLLSSVLGASQFITEIKSLQSSDFENDTLSSYLYICSYLSSVCMFLLNCVAESGHAESDMKDTKASPEETASFPSKLTLSWFDRLIYLGYTKPLTADDLWRLKEGETSKNLVPAFDKRWDKIQAQKAGLSAKNEGKRNQRTSVLPVLALIYGPEFIMGAVQKLLQVLMAFVNPLILDLVIDFINGNEPQWKGILYGCVFFVAAAVNSLNLAHYFSRMAIIGIRTRVVLTSAIFRKALKLSNNARKETTTGEIVNLMSVDAQRFVGFTSLINQIWSAPLQILIAFYFLWRLLGWSALAGLAVMIILIPANSVASNFTKKLQIKQMKNKDERIKMMSEILSGMKVLKLYAWEPSFERIITKIRDKEIKILKHSAYVTSGLSFVWTCSPFIVSLVTFAVYVLVDENNVLDAQTAFVSVSLFNVLRVPLILLPMVITQTIQVGVSIKRMNKFLNSEELDPDTTERVTKTKTDVSLEMEDGTFKWISDEKPVLHNVSLRVPPGSLVAVVGSVGSGKSSLVSAFLGEMDKVTGRVRIEGSIAYSPQIPWIQNATLQNNILFGKPCVKKFYDNVIEACALKPDLGILSGGDQTEIGEKGINLSGGQKQRISLARAVYTDADIYFLDDPLSAVDSHVGKHIFEEVIGPKGLLQSKTRIFVTHSVTYLPEVDLIVVLNDGKVSEVGTYAELLSKKGAFADYIVAHLQEATGEEFEELDDTIKAKLIGDNKEILTKIERQVSVISSVSANGSLKRHHSLAGSSKSLNAAGDVKKKGKNFKLIDEEKVETGGVKWDVYWYYSRSVGGYFVFSMLFFSVMCELLAIGSNFWLSKWSSENSLQTNGTHDTSTRDLYLGGYGLFGLGQVVSTVLSSLATHMGALQASSILHGMLLVNIFRSPLTFFDTTPLGRILNRFSKDVDTLDTGLPWVFGNALGRFINVFGTICVISSTTPLIIVIIIPVGIVYYFIQRFYLATSRQLKRLEAISRSPIYSHFSETISGTSVIRAYGAQSRFIKESQDKVDSFQVCSYPSIIAERWLLLRLEVLGNFIVFAVILLVVLNKESIGPGLVGLTVVYALQITMSLAWLVRMAADIENNIVSVERMKEYETIPQEAPWDVKPILVRNDWPDIGRIEFRNYCLRYREGLDLVLKNLTITVNGGEKIGIVGRTGAGKSSLTLALFRIIEPASGQIVIDGIDISKLGLHVLRSRITIIPQDPILFSGSLRLNLDPFEQFSDEQIWRALELAHLKTFVSSLPEKFQHRVVEGGDNLSVGQRQLICLARAILRKTKILVLDEATAAVDLETDDLIQKTIRSEFTSSTILTIAHRINTIMDSDRVLVLDKGQVVEFDSPDRLLKQRSSKFYGMAKDAGIVN